MKLQKHSTDFNDELAAKHLVAHAKRFEGHKFLLGLHCYWIKSQINHGEFGPWLQANAPELCRLDGKTPKPKTQLSDAMKFCADAGEQVGYTVDQLLENISQIQIPGEREYANGGEMLFLEDSKLPAEAKALKEKLHKGIQLQLDFENGERQAKADPAPRKKLTASELHEEHCKNIAANFESVAAALTLLIQMKDTDFVMCPPADREHVADLCLRFRDKAKSLKGEKSKF